MTQKAVFFVILSRSDLISVRPGVYFLVLELIQTVVALYGLTARL